jgi:hypothetical protein
MVESVFKDFYKKIASEAYTGSDLKSVLIKANFSWHLIIERSILKRNYLHLQGISFRKTNFLHTQI